MVLEQEVKYCLVFVTEIKVNEDGEEKQGPEIEYNPDFSVQGDDAKELEEFVTNCETFMERITNVDELNRVNRLNWVFERIQVEHNKEDFLNGNVTCLKFGVTLRLTPVDSDDIEG